MAQISAAWQCDSCCEVHDFEDEAQDCCAPRVIEGYKCGACGEFFRLKENAAACCGCVCMACGTHHQDADAATACCGMAYVERPTPAELEAAGQLQLTL